MDVKRICYVGKKLFTACDNKAVIDDFAFVAEGSLIQWVGKRSDCKEKYDMLVDLGGSFVMPGLIDAHVHLISDSIVPPSDVPDFRASAYKFYKGASNARELIEAGVMACRDLGSLDGSALGLRDAVKAGDVPGPEIVACGRAVCALGGHGHRISYETSGEDSMRQAVRQVLKDGADVVKLMVSGGVNSLGPEPAPCELTEDEIRTGIETAHARGRKVGAHAHGNTAIRRCVIHGVDSIEHGVFMTDDIMDMMAERGTYLVPTLSAPYHAVAEGLLREPGNPDHKKSEEVIARHREVLRRCSEKGVRIAMGTDAGCPYNPFTGIRFELVLMHKAGMKALDILKAATIGGARLIGVDDHLGSLEAGKEASFLVFQDDLVTDINLVEKDCQVYQRNARIKQYDNGRRYGQL